MRALVIAALLLAVASAAPAPTTEELFATFKTRHNKKYATAEEEEHRFAVFTANMRKAAALNRRNPLATFGVNKFADVSPAEFKSHHNAEKFYAGRRKAVKNSKSAVKAAPKKAANTAASCTSVNWVNKGAVTGVKNQAECGGCWAFSSTGSIEGQWFLAGNTLTSLSEQMLLSCDTNDDGCNGGLMNDAFAWLIDDNSGDITTEAAMPFVSAAGSNPESCPSDISSYPVGATISSYNELESSESVMASFVCSSGPLSIAVDADSFQTYTGGILTNCESTAVDHGVLIVGLDTSYSTPYWIIKNSWGADWGEDGYIRVEYGIDACLITDDPVTSIVGSSSSSSL